MGGVAGAPKPPPRLPPACMLAARRSFSQVLPWRCGSGRFPLHGAQRGMKYNLFPRLDFLAYLKRIHVAYHPGRERTEVARNLIMHMTSEPSKKKFPQLQATWELLGYDAPATID